MLDACVLYPAPVRDILLSLADNQLYRPKWSDLIQQEWKRSVLEKRDDLSEKQITTTIKVMGAAFPDAEVNGFSSLIDGIILPDKDDRHVLAAAIRCHADVIVTFNLKDFPVKELNHYDIEPVHPDDFIINLIDLDTGNSLKAFREQVNRLKNPPLSEIEVLDAFKNCGLKKTSKRFRRLIEVKQVK